MIANHVINVVCVHNLLGFLLPDLVGIHQSTKSEAGDSEQAERPANS